MRAVKSPFDEQERAVQEEALNVFAEVRQSPAERRQVSASQRFLAPRGNSGQGAEVGAVRWCGRCHRGVSNGAQAHREKIRTQGSLSQVHELRTQMAADTCNTSSKQVDPHAWGSRLVLERLSLMTHTLYNACTKLEL